MQCWLVGALCSVGIAGHIASREEMWEQLSQLHYRCKSTAMAASAAGKTLVIADQ
jgi:hypothetical protein